MYAVLLRDRGVAEYPLKIEKWEHPPKLPSKSWNTHLHLGSGEMFEKGAASDQENVASVLRSTHAFSFLSLEQFKAGMWKTGQWEDRDAATLCHGKQAA